MEKMTCGKLGSGGDRAPILAVLIPDVRRRQVKGDEGLKGGSVQKAARQSCWLAIMVPEALKSGVALKEMGFSVLLSFEVLWFPAKRSAVPAAICEGAASHPSLHFPSMTERVRSQEW
ncbi:hypothetical protein NQZ68_027352 [Dissostichus eleginoides]|nr:hypothetical protein NQZ68_027352 [Dissostichus eleginoides]